MEMIQTRSAAVAAIMEAGIVAPFAKVSVQELFDFDALGDVTDDLLAFDGNVVKKIQLPKDKVIEKAMNFIACEIDIVDGAIGILGEVRYNLNGDLIAPEPLPEEPVAEIS